MTQSARRRQDVRRAARCGPRRGRARTARGSPGRASPRAGGARRRATALPRSRSPADPPRRRSPASIRANSTRSGSDRSRSMTPMPEAVVRPSARTARGRSRSPSTTRSISPSQKGSISSTWARTSRGPHDASGSGAVVLGQRPWLAGHHAWGELGVGARRAAGDPIGGRSSWRPVWHARRTMVALTNASGWRARARHRGRDPPAAEIAR